MVLEKTLNSRLDYNIKPVNPKGNQSWIFIGKTDAEAEAPIFLQSDGKSWFNGKDPDAGTDWRHKGNRITEDDMVGWHHWLNGHEFEPTLWDGKGQESLAFCIYEVTKNRTQLSHWTTIGSVLSKVDGIINAKCFYNQRNLLLNFWSITLLKCMQSWIRNTATMT